MTTLAEIEVAVGSLPPDEQKELFLFLAMRLRERGPVLEPRELDKSRIQDWIADDEAEMRRLLDAD